MTWNTITFSHLCPKTVVEGNILKFRQNITINIKYNKSQPLCGDMELIARFLPTHSSIHHQENTEQQWVCGICKEEAATLQKNTLLPIHSLQN